LDTLIKNLDGKVNIALAASGFSIIFSLGVVLWAKKNISKADSEFEQWMKSHVEAVIMKEVAKLRKQVEKR
jgi:aromatic ring-opening dioxygenase catalytic subunit (LigB family)